MQNVIQLQQKIIELHKDHAGQWQYRIRRDGMTLVDWQYGPFDQDACIQQAKDRFGADCVVKCEAQ